MLKLPLKVLNIITHHLTRSASGVNAPASLINDDQLLTVLRSLLLQPHDDDQPVLAGYRR